VRYVLHRVFVQRHGWFVNGLDPAGNAWNSSSPAEILRTRQDGVQDIFESRLTNGGFDLHHVAVLAATFESLVHQDSVERLRGAYRVLGLSESEGSLSEQDAAKVIRAYMTMYVLGLDHANITKDEFEDDANNIAELYPTWPDTEIFVEEVRSVVLTDVVGNERTTWESTLKVLEQIGERYGKWQDKECRVLKTKLSEMAMPGSGRVSLDRFYAGSLSDDGWLFLESVPYLQQLGALDSTDPARLSVIIPNYINAPTNCVASSKFYSVFCMDECDAILSTLEGRVGSWQASPSLIIQLVSGLASDTVKAPRVLPDPLVKRLEDVAEQHGGQVPLHGRLFAQWMHHAYPSECPYPHASGTTTPVVAEEYADRTGTDVLASKEDMMKFIEASNASGEIEIAELPWSDHEELFVWRVLLRHFEIEAPSRFRWFLLIILQPDLATHTLLNPLLKRQGFWQTPRCRIHELVALGH